MHVNCKNFIAKLNKKKTLFLTLGQTEILNIYFTKRSLDEYVQCTRTDRRVITDRLREAAKKKFFS